MIAFLRRFVFEDFWLKLFSLAVALFIWAAVYTAVQKDLDIGGTPLTRIGSRTFSDLPVMVIALAADVREFKVKPSHVDVVVRGDAATLAKLQQKDVHVVVDLTNVKAAQNLRKKVEVSTPPGVTLHVRATPDEVEVIFPK